MLSLLRTVVRVMTIVTVFPILTVLSSFAADSSAHVATVHVSMRTARVAAVATESASSVTTAEPLEIASEIAQQEGNVESGDRLWLINTRHVTSNTRCANLEDPDLSFSRLSCRGRTARSSLEEFQSTASARPVVIYVHGNRMTECSAIERGLLVYRKTCRCRTIS